MEHSSLCIAFRDCNHAWHDFQKVYNECVLPFFAAAWSACYAIQPSNKFFTSANRAASSNKFLQKTYTRSMVSAQNTVSTHCLPFAWKQLFSNHVSLLLMLCQGLTCNAICMQILQKYGRSDVSCESANRLHLNRPDLECTTLVHSILRMSTYIQWLLHERQVYQWGSCGDGTVLWVTSHTHSEKKIKTKNLRN